MRIRVEPLSPAETARRQRQPFTYDGVGRTRTTAPPGFPSFSRTRRVQGPTDFDSAAAALMSWQVQARAGLRVATSALRIVEGAVCVMTFGPGPFAVPIPCRIVYSFQESDECGFAYGTLPGHPEAGEEAFVLRRHPDGGLDFTVTAFPVRRPCSPGSAVRRHGPCNVR